MEAEVLINKFHYLKTQTDKTPPKQNRSAPGFYDAKDDVTKRPVYLQRLSSLPEYATCKDEIFRATRVRVARNASNGSDSGLQTSDSPSSSEASEGQDNIFNYQETSKSSMLRRRCSVDEILARHEAAAAAYVNKRRYSEQITRTETSISTLQRFRRFSEHIRNPFTEYETFKLRRNTSVTPKRLFKRKTDLSKSDGDLTALDDYDYGFMNDNNSPTDTIRDKPPSSPSRNLIFTKKWKKKPKSSSCSWKPEVGGSLSIEFPFFFAIRRVKSLGLIICIVYHLLKHGKSIRSLVMQISLLSRIKRVTPCHW